MLSLYLQTSDATDPDQLRPGLEAEQVSPGLLGFLVTFLMVAAVILLILDLVRRQRRLRYRADYARRREAEEAEPAEGAAVAAGPRAGAEPTTGPTAGSTAAQTERPPGQGPEAGADGAPRER